MTHPAPTPNPGPDAQSTRHWWRPANRALLFVALCLASVVAAPQLLAFPHVTQVGDTRIYSDTPIDRPAIAAVLARADARRRIEAALAANGNDVDALLEQR